eukprot:3246-Heterococcus_DN1.PRE.4
MLLVCSTEIQYKVIPDDVPYLANLVVAQSARGQGLGAKMVKLAELLVAKKWPTSQEQLFVAVEEQNAAALRLYEQLQQKYSCKLFDAQQSTHNTGNHAYDFKLVN